ncbi:MAG: TonB family protein [Bacteroidales bacterium]|nr:TonB family protein [Bacteroidales bacterium]
MSAIVQYVFQVIACSALFAICYWAWLRNGHFHNWNRYYIWISVILSIVIPLMTIRITAPASLLSYSYMPETAILGTESIPATGSVPVSGIVVLVCLLMLIRESLSLANMFKLKRKAEIMDIGNVRLYCTNDPSAPFTFFRHIFWKKDINPYTETGSRILRHELAHVRLGHSWDKALMQLVCCFFWMNPFFFLLRRELALVHEFAADRTSIGDGNAEGVSSLILGTLYPNHDFASRFFQSSIKRRIIMINKSKTSRAILRKLSIVPIVLIAVYLFACKQDIRTSEALTAAVDSNDPFSAMEQQPLFDGKPTYLDFRDYVGKNTIYPANAAEKGIMGTVLIEFIVNKQGNVEDVKLLSGVDSELDAESLRVIRSSPKWIPGKVKGEPVDVKYQFPVNFKLN